MLLLLDEPFSNLDTGLRSSLRNLTRAQAGRLNIPAVLVTHDPEEAFLMADRIAAFVGADGSDQSLTLSSFGFAVRCWSPAP